MEAMLEREKVRQEVKEKELELRNRELNEHILANERDREEREGRKYKHRLKERPMIAGTGYR